MPTPGRSRPTAAPIRDHSGQVVGERCEAVQVRAGAGYAEAVAAGPEGGLDDVELGPALGVGAVEFRRQ